MLRSGDNSVRGVPVFVERKRIRRINVRVERDGSVKVSVPRWWATMKEAEAFLASSWDWVLRARKRALARATAARETTAEERLALPGLLAELHEEWERRLSEGGVTWKVGSMRSLWGSCHVRDRRIVYSAALAGAPRELVEYVVVHELTHLREAGHGPRFRALMDERLPDWSQRRKRLNGMDFRDGPVKLRLVQGELWEGGLP